MKDGDQTTTISWKGETFTVQGDGIQLPPLKFEPSAAEKELQRRFPSDCWDEQRARLVKFAPFWAFKGGFTGDK